MATEKKIRYDALIAHEYMAGEEKRTSWTKVGAAFPTADGKGINVELTPNLAVSGRLVLRVYEPKPASE